MAVIFLQIPVQSREFPDADMPVTIPDSLVAVQAYVMWEKAGKPQVRAKSSNPKLGFYSDSGCGSC